MDEVEKKRARGLWIKGSSSEEKDESEVGEGVGT